jgi:hypothetical protein
MARIAISYRRSDTQAMTGRIFDRLVDRYGDDSVFMDIDKIPFGYDFREQIREVLEQSDIVLAVIGPDWLGRHADGGHRLGDEADPVRFEMETALALKTPLIPVLVNDASMPKAGDLPESLRQFVYFNAAEVDAGRDFRVHMDRLMKAMDQILARRSDRLAKEASPPPSPPPAAAPVREADPPPAPVPAQPRAPDPVPAPVAASADGAPPAATDRAEPTAAPQPEPFAGLLRPMAALREAAQSSAPPATAHAPSPASAASESAAAIDWRGFGALFVYSLAAAGISLALFYGAGARNNADGGAIFAFGSMFLFIAAGAVLYWRRRYLGARAFLMGAAGAAVALAVIYPGSDSSTMRALSVLGPIALVGVITKLEVAAIIGILGALAAAGDIAAQFMARWRSGRDATVGLFAGIVTRTPRPSCPRSYRQPAACASWS